MKNIRVAAATINTILLDIRGNTKKIISVIKDAISKDVQILCLPELCITSYECEDAFYCLDIHKKAYNALKEIWNEIPPNNME